MAGRPLRRMRNNPLDSDGRERSVATIEDLGSRMALRYSDFRRGNDVMGHLDALSSAYFEYGVMVGRARAAGQGMADLGSLPAMLQNAKAELAYAITDVIGR